MNYYRTFSRGKIFTNSIQFAKFVKIFPLENNLLYSRTVMLVVMASMAHQIETLPIRTAMHVQLDLAFEE